MRPFVSDTEDNVIERYNEHVQNERGPRTHDDISAVVNAILSVGERLEVVLQNIEMNIRPGR